MIMKKGGWEEVERVVEMEATKAIKQFRKSAWIYR